MNLIFIINQTTMFGYRKKLLAKAIASAHNFEETAVASELQGMSEAQLENLELKYDNQIAQCLSSQPTFTEKLQLLAV